MVNTYIYDSTFEGLLTSVFDVWTDNSYVNIRTENESTEVSLIENRIIVQTDKEKAERISKWVNNKIGIESLRLIYRVYLTERYERGNIIFKYLKLAAKEGSKVNDHLTHPDVMNIIKADRLFSNETHRLYGYVRFEVLENNILYSQIEPEYNQLEIIAPFFADRYRGNPWIIHDTKRNIAVIFDGNMFILTEAEDDLPYITSKEENEFKTMWKNYLASLTIKERLNLELQQKHIPLKVRKYMTEFLYSKI